MADRRIHIRQAGPGDIALVRDMADIVFRKTYADILSPDQMEYMMDWMYSEGSLYKQITDEGKYFCIAEYDGIPAGYVSFESESALPDGRSLYHLQKLYVLPGYQGRGIGGAMLDHVKSFLAAACPEGCRVELNVNRNNPAVSFYEHSGMIRARQGDFPIGNGYYMNDYIYAVEL